MPPIQMRAKKASIVLTGTTGVIPATPTVLVFPGTQCSLELSEDSEKLNKLGNGVEPSREVLSGVKTISSNLEAVLNYDTAAFMLGVSVGMPVATTNVAVANWAATAVVTVGQYVKGTTPATDDLYCIKAGTTAATAPSTAGKLQDETITDGTAIWVVHKARVKEATSGIKACVPTFAIEYEFETCEGTTVYFRTLGNSAASISTSVEKKSVPKITVATNGSSVDDSITNLTYVPLSGMTPAKTIVINDANDVRNAQLSFTVGASANYPVFTFSITSDNAQEEKVPLNMPKYFTTGLRSVSGNMTGGWDQDIYKAMLNNTDSSLAVNWADGKGRLVEFTMAQVTMPLSAPTFEAGMVSNLDIAYNAYGKNGVSGLVYKVRSLQVDF